MLAAEGKKLIDSYLAWLREGFHVESANDYTLISTPFLDPHNDEIQIFLEQDGETLRLTDDGYTISDLRSSGLEINTDKRTAHVEQILNGFGVRRDGDELVVTATPRDFPQKKHNLIQAILAVLLIQCKHWRSSAVQEKVVRELLGSMTHFRVTRGAIYTLKGATIPAAAFAVQHGITIVDRVELARRAARLSDAELETMLRPRTHHCPKCESPMVWRTGNFPSFWGCSTYPRCRGTLKPARLSGARSRTTSRRFE